MKLHYIWAFRIVSSCYDAVEISRDLNAYWARDGVIYIVSGYVPETEESWFDSWQEQEIYLYSKTPRPAPGLNQPPVL
jgi:hypothetical protein